MMKIDNKERTDYRENRDYPYTDIRGSLPHSHTQRHNRHKEKEPHGQRSREINKEHRATKKE